MYNCLPLWDLATLWCLVDFLSYLNKCLKIRLGEKKNLSDPLNEYTEHFPFAGGSQVQFFASRMQGCTADEMQR